MLQVTQPAAEVLSDVRSQQGVPDHFGVRVFAGQTNDGQQAIGLGFAETPADGDAVAESEGVTLYVAPELAEPLEEAVIDVESQPDGDTLVFRRV
jgi:Fe-S cluster assembly iron-binding protein IscA